MVKLRKRANVARRVRRQHTGAFKAQVALAALREDKTMVQLCQEFTHQIPDRFIHLAVVIGCRWKQPLVQRPPGATKAHCESITGHPQLSHCRP